MSITYQGSVGVVECTVAASNEDGLIERLEGEAKRLREAKARREAEAKKTVGQRVAEEMARIGGKDGYPNSIIVRGDRHGFIALAADDGCGNPPSLKYLREFIANAIDKVRADTIEECAKAVEGEALFLPLSVRKIRALK